MPSTMKVWPNGAPFALFLSHDVDQVHDRGFYRTLGDINHFRRLIGGGELGDKGACARRIFRSVFRPKDWRPQFERILEIESAHGWKSTFFILEGQRWSRYGSRYSLDDPRIRGLGEMLLSAGCEIGVHGGYHDFSDAAKYRLSADRIEAAFGVRPLGIRNHFLRFSFPETWKAQAEAGFVYDATLGWNDKVGFREEKRFPFEPRDPVDGSPIGIVALPLTIMDTALFQSMRLKKKEALGLMEEVLEEAAVSGGLASVLWHNNYFDEEEYEERELIYAEFLRRAASYRPYCATGLEIAGYYRNTHGERIGRRRESENAG